MALLRFLPLVLSSLLLAPALAATASPFDEAKQALKEGQARLALERIEAHLAANPEDTRSRFLKGLALAQLGRPDEAIQVFTALTEEHPELAEPYNNLAVLYAAQGRYEQARRSLEVAILAHPNYATAHENLGDVYAKLATLSYAKALELDPEMSAARVKSEAIRDLLASKRPGALVAKPAVAPRPGPAQTAPGKPIAVAPAPGKPIQAPPAPTRPIEALPAKAEPVVQTRPAPKPEIAVHPLPAQSPAEAQAQVEAALQAWVEHLRRTQNYTQAELSDLEIKTEADRAEARGLLRYRSNERWGWSMKRFKLSRQADGWRLDEAR